MAKFKGSKFNDHIIGSENDDLILARKGDDFIDGKGGNDRIRAGHGNDVVVGGTGRDKIFGDRGDDILDGGAHGDRVFGGKGNDIGVYRLSENVGARDYYDGGKGIDTLRLVLTREQANSAAIQADINAFKSFLAQNGIPKKASSSAFQFTAFDLFARNWEKLEVVVLDDPKPPTLSITDSQATEGDPGGPDAAITFIVTRNGDNSKPSTVGYVVKPGSAITPDDYRAGPSPLSGEITFAPGETSKLITLDITDDQVPEPTEIFTVELSARANATIDKGVAIGTIGDDDLPAVSIMDSQATEGDPGGPDAAITFIVTRNGDNSKPSTVGYVVKPGSAITPDDYRAGPSPLSGEITFAPGETSKLITLDITDDQVPEPTEIFTVELSARANATIDKGVAIGTIGDDDLPAVSIMDSQATEGDPGGPDAAITFIVTRNGDNSKPSIVGYVVKPGSAITPDDYHAGPSPLSAEITFAPGETSKLITLSITEDLVPEDTETFTVTLSGAANAVIAKDTGTGTILDNDSAVDIIWTNGGSVVLGTAAAPATFNVGTNAAVPTGFAWTGDTQLDNWSEGSNWATNLPPAATDTAVFGATGSGTNIVDTDFQIDSLRYTGAAGHITNLNNGNTLLVGGNSSVHVANADQRTTLALLDRTTVVGHLTEMNVGITATGSGTATGVFFIGGGATLNATDIDTLSIGRAMAAGSANGSLILGSNSTLVMGSSAQPAATLDIGVNVSPFTASSAAGLLDARQGHAELHVGTLNVGYSTVGTATGTLRWDRPTPIDATNVFFSRGVGHGVLDVPAGGTFLLGTASDPVSLMGIAYNDLTGAALSTSATLDFTVTNPTFAAHVGGTLAIGNNFAGNTSVDGSLILGSNSTLVMGSSGQPAATLDIGVNVSPFTASSAAGLLDARQGHAELHVGTLNVGYSTVGTATGTLRWDRPTPIDATNVFFSRGVGHGVLDVPAGGTFLLGTASDPVSLMGIAYNDLTGAALSTSATLDFTVTNPTFAAHVGGTLAIGNNFAGNTSVDGSLILGSNSTLVMGSSGQPAATLDIGVNVSPFTASSAAGLLDARQGHAELHVGTLNVGYSTVGTATGTLRWDRPTPIDATNVFFSRGVGHGVLDVPAGGTFLLGTASDPVSLMGIAYNDLTGAALSTSATLDFTVTNPTFAAHVGGTLAIGNNFAGNTSVDGSLILGSNSTLVMGSSGQPAATLDIGVNVSPFTASSAAGLLDARQGHAELHVGTLNVGYSTVGTATGTLRWDRPTPIDATNVFFSRGVGHGVLDVPAGGTFLLGTASDPVSLMGIAYNDLTGAALSTSATLDFTVTNPTFAAHVGGTLAIGNNFAGNTSVDGSLILGSNSTLVMGSSGQPAATLDIGVNVSPFTASSAAGLLDARQGHAELHVGTLSVGSSTGGPATGTLSLSTITILGTNNADIGTGANASGTVTFPDSFAGSFTATTVNFHEGLFDFGSNMLDVGGVGQIVATTFNLRGGLLTGTAIDLNPGGNFDFTGGRLAVDVFNGTLNENGGWLAPGNTGTGSTTVNGDYKLAAAGALEIDLASGGGDQLRVNGSVDLDGNGTTGGALDVVLDFAPQLNDSFSILLNDGADAVLGEFAGLPDGATFNETFGSDIFTFAIDYQGGDGNDVALKVTAISPAPPPLPAPFAPSSGAGVAIAKGPSQAGVGSDTFMFEFAQAAGADNARPSMAGVGNGPIGKAAFDVAAYAATLGGDGLDGREAGMNWAVSTGGDDFIRFDPSTGSLYHDPASDGGATGVLVSALAGVSGAHDSSGPLSPPPLGL